MSFTIHCRNVLWQCKTSDSLAATGQQTRLEEKQSSVNGRTICTANQWVNSNTFKQQQMPVCIMKLK